MAEDKTKKKRLYMLSLPGSSPAEIKELRDNLRPFCRNMNVILTQTKVEPMDLAEFKEYLESLIKGANDMLLKSSKSNSLDNLKDEKPEPVPNPTPEQKDTLKRIREKAIKELESEGPRNQDLKPKTEDRT